jgi:hypothetical protein
MNEFRFAVTDPATGELLGNIQAGSWLDACVQAGRRFVGNFKVHAGTPLEDLNAPADDVVTSSVSYNGPAHYFRAVASEALAVLTSGNLPGITELDAIDVAFGITPTGNAGAWADLSDEPTADEVAVVGAILAAIR